MSDPTTAPGTRRFNHLEGVVMLALGALYTAAFVGFTAYFIYCALTGI